MTTGPTFEDCCPQRKSEPEWPDVEELIKEIEERSRYRPTILVARKEWRQIKSLLERVKR